MMCNECCSDENETAEKEDSDLEYEENQLIRIEKQGTPTNIMPAQYS